MKRIIALSWLFTLLIHASASTFTRFSHYSIKEGLSEINVQCMLQDSKGQMWFGTFDGLNKFNGYNFTTYKTNPGKLYGLENYRIDRIREDKKGFLWIQTYDGNTYQFDTQHETFLQVPQCNSAFRGYKVSFKNILTFDDGSIWFWGDEDGCFRVTYDASNQLKVEHFNQNNDLLSSNKVKSIFQDSKRNTWVLGSKGVTVFRARTASPVHYFREKENSAILSVAECENSIWLGGQHGKLRSYDLQRGAIDQVMLPCASDIVDIKKIAAHELFLLTSHDGFYVLNTLTRAITAYPNPTGSNMVDDECYAAYMDSKHNIWIENKKSNVIYFQTATHKITNFEVKALRTIPLTPNSHFLFNEDIHGNIWIQPRTMGFCRYNPELNKLELFYNDPDVEGQKFSSQMHCAFSDRQGNLWLCPYSHGVEKIVFSDSPFRFVKQVPTDLSSAANEVRAIYQDQNNRIWAGTKNGLTTLYDEHFNKLGYLGADGNVNSSRPLKAAVYCISGDKNGNIWIGSKGDGLYCLTKSSKKDSYSMKHFAYNPDDIYSLSSNNVYSVFQDHLNRIWIATYGGGINLMETLPDGSVRFINARNKLRNFPIDKCFRSRFITEDKNGTLFVGSTGGLVAFKADQRKPEEIRFYNYTHIQNDNSSLSGNDVYAILPAANGSLYLSVFGGGLNVLNGTFNIQQQPRFTSYQVNSGLSSNIIFTLEEDKKGMIWLSTQTDIVRFNPTNRQFDTFTPLNDHPYVFVEAAVCKTRAGGFAYGTSEGFVNFHPEKAFKSNFIPRIVLTGLQLFNKTVEVGVEESPLTRVMDETNELVLSHKQNIFSIGFAALDYTNPQNVQYAYKLDGLETDWNYVHDQRVATYTNLPKGRYVFRVKSTNADGVWVNNERSIVIVKKPSFWESAWGFVFYVFVALALAMLVAYVLYTFFRLRSNVEVEHRLTNMKLRFFTDVSHELRTPLTLIASPVENILRNEALSDTAKDQLTVVQRNTERMLRLVNQLLDFRKIQGQKMKLLVEVIHPGHFVREISLNFSKMAEERNIDFRVVDLSANASIWADKDKFEKIFYNLLSNAFKFTQPGQPIEVRIVEESDGVSVTVRDSGMGISKDRLRLLFNRFESLAGANVSFQQGTGIGLSLTKELVELHHGKIEVESEPGKGSAFKVTFLKGKEHFSNNEELVDIEHREVDDLPDDETGADELLVPDDIAENEKQTILIAEDNQELRAFLRSVLDVKYEVLEAENGRQGLELARQHNPDIIITDVMMPEMDGMEMAKAVKEDISISHIPIVLLTAKTDLENKLEALRYGVDDYITKPFSSAFLEARIENLLKLRRQLQELYRSSITTGVISPSKPNVLSQDDLFIQRVMTYIENNIENSELTIDEIAMHVALGRSTFFKKLKSLVGLSPIEFLKDMRIQRAAQLIESGEYNFSEITYMVGISDPRYFSRCFKQKFGLSPREYKDRCKEKERGFEKRQ